MNRSSRQKINKATEVLNDKIDQLDLIDIYRTLHLGVKEKKRKHIIHILFKHTWNIL